MKSADCKVVELRRYTLHAGARDTLIDLFDREFVETQEAVGAHAFPALPVRADVEAFVWLSVYADEVGHARHVADLERLPAWGEEVSQALAQRLEGSPEVLRLRPTARSLLRG